MHTVFASCCVLHEQRLIKPVGNLLCHVDTLKDRDSPLVNHLNSLAAGVSACQWIGIVRACELVCGRLLLARAWFCRMRFRVWSLL